MSGNYTEVDIQKQWVVGRVFLKGLALMIAQTFWKTATMSSEHRDGLKARSQSEKFERLFRALKIP